MIYTARGRVLGYQPQTDSGTIAGDNGLRYNFVGAQWRDPLPPNPGIYVEFGVQVDQEGGLPKAIDIYRTVTPRSKVLAGLFGILLGWLGIHKFYLGHPGKGIILILVAILVGIPTYGFATFVTILITVIEGVIYLSKSDEDFNRIYVRDKRGWF